MSAADSGVRPGWIRDVELPRSLDELRGPTTGVIRLPLRLYWSGPDPRAVEWSLTEQADCRWLYEIVLREGTLDDVRGLVDGATLMQVWDELYLPPHVRHAWQPLIDSARGSSLMPLDPLQERIIRTALALPHARTLALAGGCAVIAHGLVNRVTRDVDLFTERDADEAVELCAALRVALAEDGLRIESAARPPHENRFVAVEPSTRAETAVEVGLARRFTVEVGAAELSTLREGVFDQLVEFAQRVGGLGGPAPPALVGEVGDSLELPQDVGIIPTSG